MISKPGFFSAVVVSALALSGSAALVHGQTTATPEAAPATRPAAAPPASVIAGIPVNYDESKVGTYTLIDPLVLADGKPVRNAKTWYKERRPEIVKLFEENQFGRAPGRPSQMSFDVFDKGTPVSFPVQPPPRGATASSSAPGPEVKAIRQQVTIYFTADKSGPKMDLLIYLPAAATKPVPLLLCISFSANSSTVDDPGIKPGEIWDAKQAKRVPASQGRSFGRLPVGQILDAGFGVATFYYGDVDPDSLNGFPYGIRATYLKPGQTERAPDDWGSIGAWAWGMSRAIDYLETDKGVDAKRIAIYGASRLGKTVMWEGASDTRVALVVACCSGEGGAALSRRDYGETIAHLTAPSRYPYQFAANYAKYGGFPDTAPMDANLLVSLIAPRPVLLQTGSTDYWSDPKGEFLAAVSAGPVYKLLGADPLDTDVWPPAGTPIFHTLGYFMHEGGHGTLPGDWKVFLEFMTMHLHPDQ